MISVITVRYDQPRTPGYISKCDLVFHLGFLSPQHAEETPGHDGARAQEAAILSTSVRQIAGSKMVRIYLHNTQLHSIYLLPTSISQLVSYGTWYIIFKDVFIFALIRNLG